LQRYLCSLLNFCLLPARKRQKLNFPVSGIYRFYHSFLYQIAHLQVKKKPKKSRKLKELCAFFRAVRKPPLRRGFEPNRLACAQGHLG
jgi:hypothetical protein